MIPWYNPLRFLILVAACLVAGIMLLLMAVGALARRLAPPSAESPRSGYQGPERRGTARWQDDGGIDG